MSRTTPSRAFLAPLLLLLTLSACAAPRESQPPLAGAAGSDSDREIESRLVLLDPRTEGVGASRSLHLTLANVTGKALAFRWTIEWYDRRGLRLSGADWGWQPLELAGKASRALRVAPMPSEAASWRLRFWPAR